jgi:D-alanyl-D-alanine carboxypeptidase
VSVEAAGFSPPAQVRELMIEDLTTLGQAAREAGHPIDIAAAYRSFEMQGYVFDDRVYVFGREGALRRAARPGHSEHQLGTAVDFKSATAADADLAWAATEAGVWTIQNAPRFGFVLSYPEGATARTCYQYEPWHFRYFGRKLAAKIMDSGLTPREYLWRASG